MPPVGPPAANPGQPGRTPGGIIAPGQQKQSQSQQLWSAVGDLHKRVKQLEANEEQMVAHINKWVAKITGIDSVSYAALALHEGKTFKIDPEKVEVIQKNIEDVLKEMARYGGEQRQEAAAAAEANTNDIDSETPAPAPAAENPTPPMGNSAQANPDLTSVADGPAAPEASIPDAQPTPNLPVENTDKGTPKPAEKPAAKKKAKKKPAAKKGKKNDGPANTAAGKSS